MDATDAHVSPPAGSPFLPAMAAPVMPSANDTLMTLWNLYSRQQQQQQQHQQRVLSPQPHRKPDVATHRKLESPSPAPQSEALNLGVQRDAARCVS